MKAWFVCLLILTPSLVAPMRAQSAPPVAVQAETPKLETALAQLQHAARLKSGLRKLPGDERKLRSAAVVAAYRAVREFWPKDPEPCAEAAFRAGELLRAAADFDAAQTEFEYVRGLEIETPFRARAGLELGHLQRRAKHVAPALDAYLAVANDPNSEPERRDDAALWAGRMYAELGKTDEARRQWDAVAARAEDPLQRIDAWDELALLLVDTGDLEGAAGWIAKARENLADAALEETAQGERVRSGLERMRAIRRLERAVAAREKVDAAGK